MGITFQDMMVRSILVAIALVACVRAVPMPNDIVPETKFVEGAATSAHASAKQVVTEMIQAGSDWTACSELANATRDEVTEAVTDKQDMLDGLDKGCDCAGKGQDEVNRTLNEMNAAWTAVTDAQKDLESATNAQVQLSSQEFSFLQAGECGWIMTDAAYLSAYAIYTKAFNTLATAKTTYNLSVTAHTEAVSEAARLKLECECATQSEQAVAWADANQDNDANAAAWAQAHHIDCVVDHIAEADCSFGPAPGLTKPTLCDDIESVSCAAESGSAAPVAAESGSAAAPVATESGSAAAPVATESNGQEAGLHGSTPTVTLDIKGTAGPTGIGMPMLELSAGKSQVSAQLDTGSPGVYFVSPTTVYETKEGTPNVISCPRTYTPEDSKRSSTCRKKLVYGGQTVYGECYTDTVSLAGKSVTVEFTVATKIVSFSPPLCGIIGAGMDSAFMHGLVQGLDANRFSIGMKFEVLSDPDQGKLWIGDDGTTQAYTGELITFPILPDDRIMMSGVNQNGDALAKKSMHWQLGYDVEMDGDRLENEQGFFDSGANTVIFSRNILAPRKSYWQKHAPS